MDCKNCGATLKNDQIVCTYCETQVEISETSTNENAITQVETSETLVNENVIINVETGETSVNENVIINIRTAQNNDASKQNMDPYALVDKARSVSDLPNLKKYVDEYFPQDVEAYDKWKKHTSAFNISFIFSLVCAILGILTVNLFLLLAFVIAIIFASVSAYKGKKVQPQSVAKHQEKLKELLKKKK